MSLNKLENNEIVELSDGDFCGARTVEVKIIPKDLSEKDDQEKYSNISKIFLNLTRELHSVSRQADVYFDMMWLSEPVENQLYKSKIKFFIVVRCINDNITRINHIISILQSIIVKTLENNNYVLEVVDINNEKFKDLIKSVNSIGLSIIKEDVKIPSVSGLSDFYYMTPIFPSNSNVGFEELIKSLINYPNSAIIFQIKPYKYDENEKNLVSYIHHQLSTYVNGFYEQYYGQLQDTLAKAPLEVFDYYLQRSDSTLFLFNIVIFSSEENIIPLTTSVSSILQPINHEKNVPVKICHIDKEITLAQKYFTLPWNVDYEVNNNRVNLDFWQDDKSPKSLFYFSRIITDEEANCFFRLPIAVTEHINGIEIEKHEEINESFDAVVFENTNINLGILKGTKLEKQIGLPVNDLKKHMFISGTTRSGKTTAVFNILSQIYNKKIPFLVLEMVKTEYRPLLDLIPDLKIFTPGKSDISPFIINPFIPPKNVKLINYKSYLLTAFKASFEMSGPLLQLFTEAINQSYVEYGWKDNNTIDDESIELFGMYEFIKEFKDLMETKNYDPKVRNNIEEAGVVRLMNLINVDYNIFDNQNSIPIEDLLNNNVIIELDAIANLEQKSLIASLLLNNIIAYIKNNSKNISVDNLNQLLVLEEAHVLLEPKVSTRNEDKSGNVAIEIVDSILSEMAAYGFGLIVSDQSPQKMPKNVIINTGTKIILRTTEGEDKEIIKNSTNMSEEQQKNLSSISNGAGYCFFDRIKNPLLIQTPNIKVNNHLRDKILDNEVKKKDNYWKHKDDFLIPYHECKLVGTCKNCNQKIRVDGKYFSQKILKKYFKINNAKDTAKRLQNINKFIKESVGDNSSYKDDIKLNHCIKIQLLRGLEMETNLKMHRETRNKLLSNKKFLSKD